MRCTDNGERRPAYTEREWARIQARERREQQRQRRLYAVAAALFLAVVLMGFAVYYFVVRSHDRTLTQAYNRTDTVLGIGSSIASGSTAQPFAQKLCVAGGDMNTEALGLNAYAAGLFDVKGQRTVYAKDIFSKRSPASITKVMTALVTLKYGNLDDVVTVTPIVKDIEYGSSVCDIKEGDILSLRQLLYGMMIASGNDASMMIAEHVGGSVENFVAMMNEEAQAIGATSTHFMNPHGLTDPEHYTTVYDIYLMMNEALKYEIFQDIISRKNYYAEYKRTDGTSAAVTWETTNHYLLGTAETPQEVVVYGGKTGTTDDAGACLTLLAKDLYGNPYVSVILHSESKETLYTEMTQLLSLVAA